MNFLSDTSSAAYDGNVQNISFQGFIIGPEQYICIVFTKVKPEENFSFQKKIFAIKILFETLTESLIQFGK